MSEYQYYEFRALDRPLTDAQMRELRTYSSRAQITPTGFVNSYSWGDFKGNVDKWMEAYFDAFLYVANWGTRQLMFRVPKRLLDPETVSEYCDGESLSYHVKGGHLILSFESQEEGGEWEEGEGWMAALLPLRSDLMHGDLRNLYLGWLVAAEEGRLGDDALEPPVPPGLGNLSAPLSALAEFLRIDSDLIDTAAERSGPEEAFGLTPDEITDWVAKMPLAQKDALIAALLEGHDPHAADELRKDALHEIRAARDHVDSSSDTERRTAGQLLARARSIDEQRQAREAERRARETAAREQAEAERREKYLKSLVGQEEGLWAKVDKLIATRNPKRYDDAVSILRDLRDSAALSGRSSGFSARLDALSREHAGKPSLQERFRKADLVK